MRAHALILTLVAATLLIAPAISQEGATLSRDQQIEESVKKVKQLRQERIAALKAMANVINIQKSRGLAPDEDVLEAKLLVFKAELDASEKQSDRVMLFQSIVDVLKEYEQFADAMSKAIGGSEANFLKIKARRLEAEILLEQAKTSQTEEGK
jgi:hypothetical protein